MSVDPLCYDLNYGCIYPFTAALDWLDSINKYNSFSAAFDEKFLYRRNEIQASSIDSIIKSGKSLFVGVGAAHLPGMVAAQTILPVIGVPVKSSNSIDGWDSVLSILQMPYGVPVATVALNGAKNAGILAAQILALHDTSIAGKLEAYKEYQDDIVMESVKNVRQLGFTNEFDV